MPDQSHLARIDSVSFGSIVIDGKTYTEDIVITANGNVLHRDNEPSERRFGTHHVICKEELQLLLQGSPRILVIGTGQYGACRVEAAMKDELIKNGIKLITERTPKAISIFNSLSDRKAGLFHLTC